MKPILIASALVLVSCTSHADRLDANKTVARQLIDAINSNDLDALDSVVAPDVVRHSQATPGVTVRDIDDFKNFIRQDKQSVPDARIDIEIMVAEGDYVAMIASYRGTQSGPMGPFPASNRPVDLRFLSFIRLSGGHIAEIWAEWDNLSMLTSLGHIAPPSAPGAP